MNILVTGGAGYIGSHCCKALAEAGLTPIAYDNLARGHRWAVKWGPFEQGDICDRSRLLDVMKRHRPSAVIHFAAHAYVGESVMDPLSYYQNNVVGSLVLLGAMRDADVRNIVFSSSCATYGIPDYLPIREDHPQRAINPYGNTKICVERMLRDFDAAYGLRSTSLRYFNAAGADEDGEIGEDHEPETHLIPLAIRAALTRECVLEIYGADYSTPDGTAIRDYVHVMDLANAHVAALRYLTDGGPSTALNLGTGRGYSVRQVIECVERIGGRSIPARVVGRRPGDPAELVADPSRAYAVLGWHARYSALETIVETAWQWHASQQPAKASGERS